jgi:uncharacterized RDD family membrane protein YckC
MTEPMGGPPAAPGPVEAPVPPPAPGDWQAPPPAPAAGGFGATVEPGPAPGVSYADLVSRIVAMIIDGLLLGVLFVAVTIVVGIVVGIIAGGTGLELLFGLVGGVLWAIGSALYYVYTWTTMRASPGQKMLSLETVNAADGATLTRDQAIRRWAYLWGPFALSSIVPILGGLLGLLAIGYAIYLLYTASQSPKRQGFHDVQASTVVVKRG